MGTEKNWSVYVDGASRGNPGPAASGFVVCDQAGEIILADGCFIGRETNNVAEYTAFALALYYLKICSKTHTISHAIVYADSQLMVRQANKIYKVKHPVIRKLFAFTQQLIAQLPFPITVVHVRRELNTAADEQANFGLDSKNKLPPQFEKDWNDARL